MPLSQPIQEIIAKTEQLSGRSVVVREDPALQNLATVSIARGASPFHLVRYKPGGASVNYLIAYQLCFIVRMFSCRA
ncbi:MAG: hypothetical protein H8E24_04405 [Verrucomicrobia bacterium]|nr:hypothetical protein [Verrucomicrobiota bacterium]